MEKYIEVAKKIIEGKYTFAGVRSVEDDNEIRIIEAEVLELI